MGQFERGREPRDEAVLDYARTDINVTRTDMNESYSFLNQ